MILSEKSATFRDHASVAEAAAEGIVPAVSPPVAIAGTGIAAAIIRGLGVIGVIGAGRVIIGSATTAAARSGGRNDDNRPHRNRYGRGHDHNTAAPPAAATPGAGSINCR